MDSWNESKFNWLDLLIKFREIGYSHDVIFDLSVTTDFRNNTRHIIELDQASLGMPVSGAILRSKLKLIFEIICQDRSYILKGNADPLVRGKHAWL